MHDPAALAWPVAALALVSSVGAAGIWASLDETPAPAALAGAPEPGVDHAQHAGHLHEWENGTLVMRDAGADGAPGSHDHGGAGHGGNTTAASPYPRPSVLGQVPYDGPREPGALLAACPDRGTMAGIDCAVGLLKRLLAAEGSEVTFTVLEQMAALDSFVNAQSHRMAHELGWHALDVYGSVEEALRTCSYKVFAGCFHGALQAYFLSVPELDPPRIVGICPSDNAFRQYTCLHGLGHGLMLATNYAMNRSLQLCDALDGFFAQGSCHGGVFMENIVAYIDYRVSGTTHTHGGHGGHGVPAFVVDPDDPYFPCDAVGAQYQTTCWLIHTSLILFYNGGDFRDGARKCDGAVPHTPTCYRSLGRDASGYTNRDVAKGVEYCSYATPEGRAYCIRGFVAESVLNYATPEAGLPVCRAMPEVDKAPCYEEMAVQGSTMVSPEVMAQVCARAEQGYEDDCRRGGGLPS